MNLAVGTLGKRRKGTGRGIWLATSVAAALALVAAVGLVAAGVMTDGGGKSSSASNSELRGLPRAVEPEVVLYVVRDEAQAARVRAAQDDAALVRYEAGELDSIYVFDVLVHGDEAAFWQAIEAFDNANAVRFAMGVAEMKLVDLR